MPHPVKVAVDAPGFRLRFEGSRETWEGDLQPLVDSVARGSWKEGSSIPEAPAGPADPDALPAAVASSAAASVAAPPAVPPVAAEPGPVGDAKASASPPPPPTSTTASAADWDPRPLYALLAAETGRRAERDAVLLALVSLAAAGRRDSTPSEVLAHMEGHGFPSRGIRAKPVLAKLCHRRGMAVPGLLPNTFRATPAGSAYVWKRAKGM